MASATLANITDFAAALTGNPALPGLTPPRLISIWEITSWILPMAPEHLRRVLAANPGLPQGSAGVEGGTRWFTATDVASLRLHFAARARQSRYQPQRPAAALAPLIALAQPLGKAGRSTAVLHLATSAALAGYRVLLIDADPTGELAKALHVTHLPDTGVLGLIARSAARHLRQGNEARLDRGEPPLGMDEMLNAALGLQASTLIRPTLWPGLDLLPAGPALMQADMQIGSWRLAQRSWQPWRALAEALDADGLRADYDLILCDTGRGLGPLALSMLASADVLLAPMPVAPAAPERLGAGLQALATGLAAIQAEVQMTSRALGQTAAPLLWRKLAVLPVRAAADAGSLLAGFAAKLGPALLPAALPEVAQIANGTVAQFYDLDYRDVGRLIYAPQREATEAAWRGVAGLLAELWAEDATQQSQLSLGQALPVSRRNPGR